MSVLSKCRSFTENSCTKAAVLPKGRSFTANSETKVAVLLGLNRCGSFPLLSAPHSHFSIWTDLKRCEKIPGAPTWRWGKWIWLTGPSGPNRNSPTGVKVPLGFLTRSEIQKSQSPFAPLISYSYPFWPRDRQTPRYYVLCRHTFTNYWMTINEKILDVTATKRSNIKNLVFRTRPSVG